MEVYKSETREVIKRFRARMLTFHECIAALDAALAGVLPKITNDQLEPLRALMFANNEIVMKEMERRGPPAHRKSLAGRPLGSKNKAKARIN